ncbi:hypothetical protein B0F90DRAFT_540707 [Multifurca ochricompacta]|uniref:Uncharacterized protein n=1 Tax=Multifurca ochricompacta TaxID=376703 RepID=A0AAD4MDN2_9AGAM|nr:hypothetical protein B0F90DRAFT_540707 [Multifurca ochricompacta]
MSSASASASASNFDAKSVLTYLGLPLDYDPSPATAPVPFLNKHLHQLPFYLLHSFSATTTPQQRTAVLMIRNRRFNFTQSDPPELRFAAARQQWPSLWEGAERFGHEVGREEKEWADTAFLGGGNKVFVGKLGTLLGEYEEERQVERARLARRSRQDGFIPEEEDESSDDDQDTPGPATSESAQAVQDSFLRRVRERFIYGQLEVSH